MNMKQWEVIWLTIALAFVSVSACAAEKTTYYVTNAHLISPLPQPGIA